jgi:hypothetical protein
VSRLVAAPVPTRSPWLEPQHAFPVVEAIEAGQLLADAVAGVELGNADRALLVQLECHWSPESVALLASLLLRARELGARAGVAA